MEQITSFVGIDISKQYLDCCLLIQGEKVALLKGENSVTGISSILNLLINKHGLDVATTVFCMEHTGIYNNFLLEVLQEHSCMIWLENPYHIKMSLGLQRGKSDEIDAWRIAKFAYKNREEVKLWKPEREVFILLCQLNATRDRLQNTKNALLVPLQEQKLFWSEELYAQVSLYSQQVIDATELQLQNIEKKIEELISNDTHLNDLFKRITSVPGLGARTATQLIIETNEFKSFDNARQLACYAGVAPFVHRSGSSVRGRTRVSQKANKKLKTLLHLAVLSFCRTSGKMNVFKAYYQRKVAQGKDKMSVLNALRNKMLHTVFALVQKQEFFQNNYDEPLICS
jgi:transposase